MKNIQSDSRKKWTEKYCTPTDSRFTLYIETFFKIQYKLRIRCQLNLMYAKI